MIFTQLRFEQFPFRAFLQTSKNSTVKTVSVHVILILPLKKPKRLAQIAQKSQQASYCK